MILLAVVSQIPDVVIEPAFPKLSFKRPLLLTWPRDGTDRLFVLEQDGVVHVFDNKADAVGTQVALDFRAQVSRKDNEEGLLGMAFHPKFKSNGFIFLFYTPSAAGPRRNHVSRFTMDAARKRIIPESERVLLSITKPYGNHDGGMIEFGPDGFLYITVGDGGSAGDPHNNGQNLKSLLGKIHRIDVDRSDGPRAYGIPNDNPFAGKPDSGLPEIFAYGLRNTWRFSFDRKTGDLWGGDVGQDAWEEINLIRKGGNYGWSVREGLHKFKGEGGPPQFMDPVIEHNRRDARSITGGYVYRGKKIKGLQGVYLYGDYVTGNVWGLVWDGQKVVENKLLGNVKEPASFGEDRDGEVYICSFDGRLYRFRGK